MQAHRKGGSLRNRCPLLDTLDRGLFSCKEVVLSTSHHITLEIVIVSVTRARKSEREIIWRGKRQRAFVRGGEGAALIKILFLSINPFLMCVYALSVQLWHSCFISPPSP